MAVDKIDPQLQSIISDAQLRSQKSANKDEQVDAARKAAEKRQAEKKRQLDAERSRESFTRTSQDKSSASKLIQVKDDGPSDLGFECMEISDFAGEVFTIKRSDKGHRVTGKSRSLRQRLQQKHSHSSAAKRRLAVGYQSRSDVQSRSVSS